MCFPRSVRARTWISLLSVDWGHRRSILVNFARRWGIWFGSLEPSARKKLSRNKRKPGQEGDLPSNSGHPVWGSSSLPRRVTCVYSTWKFSSGLRSPEIISYNSWSRKNILKLLVSFIFFLFWFRRQLSLPLMDFFFNMPPLVPGLLFLNCRYVWVVFFFF